MYLLIYIILYYTFILYYVSIINLYYVSICIIYIIYIMYVLLIYY